jgi:hypothetical protein
MLHRSIVGRGSNEQRIPSTYATGNIGKKTLRFLVFGLTLGHFKAIASADGRDFQMQRGMPGVPAIVQECLRRFPLRANLHQVGRGCVDLAEMSAQTALSFVNLHHESDLLYEDTV